jgi:hypothetical protein
MAFEKWQYTPEIGEITSAGWKVTCGENLETDFARAVVGDTHATHVTDVTRRDGIDPPGAQLAREHRESTRPRADLHNNGSFPNGLA